MSRLRTTLVLIAVLAVAACTDDSKAPATDPTTSTTATAATTNIPTSTTSTPPTTTTSTSTSIAEPTTVPESVNSSSDDQSTSTLPAGPDDWLAIVQTLGQRRQDLYAAPDVSRITEVCADQTECFDQLNVQLGDLASKGWKVVDADPFVVLDAQVERFDGDSIETSLLVTVIVTVQRPADGGRIIDSGGATVADVEAETPVGFNTVNRTVLARAGSDDDPWRIVSQERIRQVPA